MSVLVVTSLGDIVIDLYSNRCPLTCKNFLKLCKIKYYNGCLFHNIQKDFTAQTGDPTGSGTGGDSIYKFLYGDQARFFADEIHLDLKHSKTGTVAMASAGKNLNASQFYFTLCDDLDYLDGKHTVFGEIAEGLETLMRINEAYVDDKGRPYKNIRIKHMYILDDPFDEPSQFADMIPQTSPEGKPKAELDDDVRLEDDWVPMDEQLGSAELEELIRSKDAHSSAVVLEAIGDIPEAEIKPPENVLFVCKLNPVTEDDDLHTIFSRFGTVVSAEIIRDFKTGDSLCYSFIEFDTQEACEQAYFKMDNALIDDRRIHVDFSQSVSKLWSQYRRKDHQMDKGKGCFRCGKLDHVAKDCTGGPAMNQPTNFILKDNNGQHGGDDNSRYEMVFDENTQDAPQEKRQRDHEAYKEDERKMISRSTSTDAYKYDEKDSIEHHRQSSSRSRKYRNDKYDNSTKSNGTKREQEYIDDRKVREKISERRDKYPRSENNDGGDYRKDERNSRKRSEGKQNYTDGDLRKRSDDKSCSNRDLRKRREDYEQDYRHPDGSIDRRDHDRRRYNDERHHNDGRRHDDRKR